jgi:hypothetical protein
MRAGISRIDAVAAPGALTRPPMAGRLIVCAQITLFLPNAVH